MNTFFIFFIILFCGVPAIFALVVTPSSIQTNQTTLLYQLANPSTENINVTISSICLQESQNIQIRPQQQVSINLTIHQKNNCTVEYFYTSESSPITYTLYTTIEYQQEKQNKEKTFNLWFYIGLIVFVILFCIILFYKIIHHKPTLR